MPVSDSFLASSVCRLLTCLLSKSIPQNMSEETAATVASMQCVIALSWGLGGHLTNAIRAQLAKALLPELRKSCKQLEWLPDSLSIYDITADVASLDFKTFESMIPKFEFQSCAELGKIFVPTARTVAYEQMLYNAAEVSSQP